MGPKGKTSKLIEQKKRACAAASIQKNDEKTKKNS